MTIHTEQELLALCLALIGRQDGLSAAERKLAKTVRIPASRHPEMEAIRLAISDGNDPLGDIFTSIRTAAERRSAGAIYTPAPIVHSMMAWLAGQGTPARIVDPGAGSGRFILAAGATFPDVPLVAVEQDPLAALMLRANLSARGWADRTTVLVKDYREVKLPRCTGMTAFVGNPPYVRHHDITEDWKAWYASTFARFGIKASALAGLHLHFFLQTRLLAKTGDVGAFVTSAEWMDVNYGSALRRLLLDELGGIALHVLEPTAAAFPGTATTAAITCFRVGETAEPVRVRAVDELQCLNGLSRGIDIPRKQLHAAPRWSIVVRRSGPASAGDIVILAGIPDITVGETITTDAAVEPLPAIRIDPPTISMTFMVNNSPFAGKEGKLVTTRHIRDRLMKETETNVGLKVEEIPNSDSYIVSGRGELHLSVLIEQMRREGFELQVSRPEVIMVDGPNGKEEPVEQVIIDVPETTAGTIIDKLNRRKGEMVDMKTDEGHTRMEWKVPTRGLLGFRGDFIIETRGEGILNHSFLAYESYKGDIPGRSRGSMISMLNGVATAYDLWNLQERGQLFIGDGVNIYEGMILGESAKDQDLVVNVTKGKKLTNMRASGSDDAVNLTPIKPMSLEQALEYIDEDELVEITPVNIRLRKKILNENERKRAK